MSHPVKCFYCGERFDRDWEPAIKINSQRYAHERCVREHERKTGVPTFNFDDMPKGEKKTMSKAAPANTNMTKMVTEMQNFMMQTIAEASSSEIFEAVMPKIDARIKEVYGFLPEIHEIKTPTETRTVTGVLHEKFDEVLQIVSLDIPVYLTGKAGTGKNVICKQVAEALGLDFYFTNAVTQEYKLTGFIDANGHYQETQFYKAFTKGGVFFLDEMDASVPETLIILNAAIANRYFDFPIGKIEAHPDFRVIAAGNTLGTGADNNYTGRYCLDRASLDRFAMVNIDYSQKIEMSMANDNVELVNFCHAFREVADKSGIECLFSYRTINRIAKLEGVFNNLSQILQISLLKGLDVDDVNILSNELSKKSNMRDNKYVKALKTSAF
jgi:hypothetical protein